MVKGGKNQGASDAERERTRNADESPTADPRPRPDATDPAADGPDDARISDAADAKAADGKAAAAAATPEHASTTAQAGEADAVDAAAGPLSDTTDAPETKAAQADSAATEPKSADASSAAAATTAPAGQGGADSGGSAPADAPEAAAEPAPAAEGTPAAAENPADAAAEAPGGVNPAAGEPTAQAAEAAGSISASTAAGETAEAGSTVVGSASGDVAPAAAADHLEPAAASGPMPTDADPPGVAADSNAPAGQTAAVGATTEAGIDAGGSSPADALEATAKPRLAAESATQDAPAAAAAAADQPEPAGAAAVDPACSSADPGTAAAADGAEVAESPAEFPAPSSEPAAADPVPPVAPAGGAPANELSISPAFLPPAVTPVSRRRRRWKRVLVSMAVAMAVLISAAGATAYFLYRRFDGQITTDAVDMKIGPERPPVMPEAYGAVNILLMGSDDRTGDNVEYGDIGEGTKRSDTTILLHLSADRKSSVAVSIPRDLMVQIPSCVRDDGTQSRAYKDQFNHAFEIGGSACTIKTVEQMTRVKIDHHIVLDFTGFKRMVDAVDGVEVCLSEPLKDRAAKLDLPAGRRTLDGEQALAYVRARKNLDDGSDTMRMTRQQRFLASLMNKVESDGVLFNPIKLYELLDAGTRSISADPGLDSLDELTKLSKSVANIPSDKSAFLTVPRQQYRYDHNRDELVQPDADALFTAIRFDRIAVGKADPAAPVEPGGTVEVHDDAMPKATATTGEPTGKATDDVSDKPTRKATDESSDEATDEASDAPADSASDSASDNATGTPAGATADPTGSATASTSGSPAPTGSGSAPPTAGPSASGGPIVTVTGRTVDQDVCA